MDIVDTKSEAFAQAAREFGIRSIPYVRLYGKDGKDLGSVGRRISDIEAALKKALE